MRILQVNTDDIGGGAARVAWGLFNAYRERGHSSWFVVGRKSSADSQVVQMPRSDGPSSLSHLLWVLHGRLEPLSSHVGGVRVVRRLLHTLAGGWREVECELGWEDFYYPTSRRLLSLLPAEPDIVHLHNLHGGYFDLRFLARLSQRMRTILTLHDEWLLTGHCACTMCCQRWEEGCGECPDLAIYPAIQRDATRWNWRRKKRIYRRANLRVATPSKWLGDRVQRSMLCAGEVRVIPNGVDVSVYQPADRQMARSELGLRPDAKVLLAVAHRIERNRFRDYPTMVAAVARVAANTPIPQPLVFVALGSDQEYTEVLGKATVRHVPYEPDPGRVARYYQAADVYLHAAHSDNFPTTVLEAMACGTPVVATAVGGIPEQIEDGHTGHLVSGKDSLVIAQRIRELLEDSFACDRMGKAATQVVQRRYTLEQQADRYMDWYLELLDEPM